MRYRIAPSKQFSKTLQKLRKGGNRQVDSALREVLLLLSTHDNRSLFVLSKQWRDHALKGNLKNVRELHLDFDSLLLYRINKEKHAVVLLDIVTHDELEKM